MTHSTPQTRHPAVGRCSDTGISLSMSTLFCMCLKLFSNAPPEVANTEVEVRLGGGERGKRRTRYPRAKTRLCLSGFRLFQMETRANTARKGWRSRCKEHPKNMPHEERETGNTWVSEIQSGTVGGNTRKYANNAAVLSVF